MLQFSHPQDTANDTSPALRSLDEASCICEKKKIEEKEKKTPQH